MTNRIDPNTGLPRLNPGWTWRIEVDSSGEGFVIGLWYGGHREEFELIFTPGTASLKPQHLVTAGDFQKAAWKVLAEYNKRHANSVLDAEARKRFVGTYPPKKLEVSNG